MLLWIQWKANVLLKFYFDKLKIYMISPQHFPALYVTLTAFAYSNNFQSNIIQSD